MAKELFVYAETKSKFLSQKLVGKIDDTQIGIIAETGEFWFQDSFYPLIAVAKVAFSGSYIDLEDKPTIPSAITENTVSGWGFTKNNGTITEVKMNGKSKGTSGVVDLGTVLTEHQDISGKVDKVQGKGLSTNDFTSKLKSKLESLENYDDTKLQETLKALRQEVTLIVSKNTNDSIESLEEVIEFLSDFKDDENLHDIVSFKMDKPSQTAMLGLPNKVMTWDGSSAMMSLPIANGLDDWGNTNSPHGYLVTDQQVQAKIDSIANKNEVVDFANDLTGVLEATAEEFTFRPSAGDKSIRDESAVIRKIKGNTVVFAQLADHASSLQREGDWSVAVEVTASTWGTFSSPVQVIAGHKYLFYINKKDGRSITDAYTLLKGAYTVHFDEPLFIIADETASWRWTARYQTSTNGLRFQTQAFDLTRLFGAGNEPATIEEFRSSFPDSYYPYSEPKVRNVNTTLIMTIGFNQWDEQWELGALSTADGRPVGNNERGHSVNFLDVIPNASYYCATIAPTTTNSSGTVGSIGVWWYDSNQTMIKYDDITNKTRIAPSNARYAKICSYGGDVNAIFNGGVNINLSHSGVRDGKYEPYKKNIRLLPEIYKYFPDGMNGNANVWDEINTEKAIKRWGVVDLGTLTWVKGSTGTSGVYRWLGKGIEHLVVKTVDASDIPNIVCAKYILSSASNIWAATMPMQVSLDSGGNVLIYDSEYNTGSTTTADFTAHLQGVLLYYELAEPEYTDITEPMQLDYEVEDFGTEKALSLASSAPFRADIVYQFNAEGRIRDNSRNIERIENTITNRLIPSQTAFLGLPNKVMVWDGNKTMMSLPIAESIADWETEESSLSALPTGKQVIEYISLIKGSLASGLMPKETIGLSPNGTYPIGCNKAYEMATAANITYNIGLHLITTTGVDVTADNEWRIRIDARNGFSGNINFELSDGYLLRWAYPDDISSPSTAPSIAQGYIYDIRFRMIGRTLLGTYKKY